MKAADKDKSIHTIPEGTWEAGIINSRKQASKSFPASSMPKNIFIIFSSISNLSEITCLSFVLKSLSVSSKSNPFSFLNSPLNLFLIP